MGPNEPPWMRGQARALLLNAPLRAYLTSVARKGMWGRWWVRELLVGLLAEGAMPLAFDANQLIGQTDLQATAVGWLSQQAMFHDLARQSPTASGRWTARRCWRARWRRSPRSPPFSGWRCTVPRSRRSQAGRHSPIIPRPVRTSGHRRARPTIATRRRPMARKSKRSRAGPRWLPTARAFRCACRRRLWHDAPVSRRRAVALRSIRAQCRARQ